MQDPLTANPTPTIPVLIPLRIHPFDFTLYPSILFQRRLGTRLLRTSESKSGTGTGQMYFKSITNCKRL